MSPEEIALVQTVSLEAIKILGPAIVAAYAGYKAASVQIEVKLRELDKNHQFQARENIFSHLKDRLTHIDEQTERLNADLGRMLGFAAGCQDFDHSAETNEFVELMTGAMKSVAKLAPLEATVLLNDMRISGLASSHEFEALSAQTFQLEFDGPASYLQLKANVLKLLETYGLLGVCTRLLLQKQMERVFAPYLAAAN
ncbi:MAG: hypothetical protein V4454_11795 [Pseudomonadota bacterium]